MKQLINQIEFVDKKLLPLFGIQNIYDYKTVICLQEFDKIVNLVENLNNILDQFKEVFPIKNFNLHKTNNKIISNNHAFNFLKKCLETAVVPFYVFNDNNNKYMRLISLNKTLYNYIFENKKMSEKRNNVVINQIENNVKINGPDGSGELENKNHINIITGDQLIQCIKKEHEYNFSVKSKYLFKDYKIKKFKIDPIDFDLSDKVIKSFQISLRSLQKNNHNILTQEYIDHIFMNSYYEILIGGNKIYDNVFTNGNDIMPKNMLLMFELLKFHDVSINIFNDIDDVNKILDLIIFDFKIIYVDFYEKIIKSFVNENNMIEFMIQKNNLINIFQIYMGLGKLLFATYVTQQAYDDYKSKNKLSNYVDFEQLLKPNININKISGDQIMQNIEKEYEYNFFIKPKDLFSNDNIIINPKNYDLLDKIIKSFKITFKSVQKNNHNILTQEYIDNLLKNSCYEIYVGSSKIYDNIFANGADIIPKNILLMNNLLKYHEVIIKIINIDGLNEILDFLIFDFKIICVDFNENFKSTINGNTQIEFIMYKNDLINMFRMQAGMGGIAFSNYITQQQFDEFKTNNILPHYLNDEILKREFEYNIIKIGDIEGFNVNKQNSNSNCLELLCHSNGANFVRFKNMHIHDVVSYITIDNNIMINNYDYHITRYADLFTNLVFDFKKQIDFNNLKIFVKNKNQFELLCINNNNQLIDISNNLYNMLSNQNYEKIIKLTYINNDINFDPFDKLIINFDFIHVDSKPRKILATNEIFKLTPQEFENLYK